MHTRRKIMYFIRINIYFFEININKLFIKIEHKNILTLNKGQKILTY